MERKILFRLGLPGLLALVAYGAPLPAQVQMPPAEQPPTAPAPAEGTITYRSTKITIGPASQIPSEVRLPAGITPMNNPRAHEAIRDVFQKTVDVAAKGELNNIVDQLAGPDRERLESLAGGSHPDLTAAARHFDDLWKARYHGNFKIAHEHVIYGPQFVAISMGEITNPAALRDWPLNPTPETQVGKTPTSEAAGASGQVHLERGRDVATAVIPATADLPELTVSLVHEAPDFWKIDVPDTLSLTAIKDSLVRQFNWLATHENEWPADQNEARRMVSHRVLMALYGL